MAQIDKIAFFGDSYCYDTLALQKDGFSKSGNHFRNPRFVGGEPPTEASYMDIFAERAGATIVHNGVSGHGPNWMMYEFMEWLKAKSQEEINSTHFVFLWSDPGREIYKADDTDKEHGENLIHLNERALMGPDAPMLDETDRFDPRVAQAIRLYWLYLKNDKESYRIYDTTKLAWKYLIEQYNIISYQQYHCFFHTAKHDKESHMFTYKGKEHRCLFEFAHGHEDYAEDDSNYMNHFSPMGQISMADVCEQAYRKIHG